MSTQHARTAMFVSRTPSAPWMVLIAVLAAFACFSFDPFYAYKYAYRDVLIENVDLVASAISTADDPGRRYGLLALGAIGAALLLFNSRRLLLRGPLALLLLLFLAMACMSALWASDADLSVRRIIVLIILMIAATGIAARCSLPEIAWFGFIAGCLLLAVGILCEIMLGTFNPFASRYRFSGLLNPLGTAEVASVMILSAVALAPYVVKGRMLLVMASACALTVILLTRSRGPLAALLIALAVHCALTWPVVRTLFMAQLALVLGLLLVVFGDQLGAWLLLGRTQDVMTLTGRLPLWEVMFKFVGERPWLGYGYNAFWTPDRFAAVALYTGFNVADAHNSYINMLLSLGLLGALSWCTILAGAVVRSVRLFKWTGEPAYVYACTMLVFHALNGALLSVFFVEHLPSLVALVVLVHIVFVSPSRSPRCRGREYEFVMCGAESRIIDEIAARLDDTSPARAMAEGQARNA